MIGLIFAVLFAWHICGIIIYAIISAMTTKNNNFRLISLNPIWIYKNFKVNYFGCFCLSLLFNILCPIVTIFYWFYKLCTIGRKI